MGEEKKLEDAALTASTRLKEALQKERHEKTELQKNFSVIQVMFLIVAQTRSNFLKTYSFIEQFERCFLYAKFPVILYWSYKIIQVFLGLVGY